MRYRPLWAGDEGQLGGGAASASVSLLMSLGTVETSHPWWPISDRVYWRPIKCRLPYFNSSA
ncbi:protein of unknown function (plasmid) [Cupriavidus taiwanensis]|nr:protein of unknown function [Cupriavidus taiwanensis]